MRFSEHPILKGPSPEAIKKLCFNDDGSTKPEGLKALAVSYTHLTLPTKRIV